MTYRTIERIDDTLSKALELLVEHLPALALLLLELDLVLVAVAILPLTVTRLVELYV